MSKGGKMTKYKSKGGAVNVVVVVQFVVKLEVELDNGKTLS